MSDMTDSQLDDLSAETSEDFGGVGDFAGEGEADRMAALYNVPVQISVVLGQASLPVNQLLKLGRGAVVEIDRKVGEAVDIHINNHLVARGEVVIVEDNRLGVTLTEIVRALPPSA